MSFDRTESELNRRIEGMLAHGEAAEALSTARAALEAHPGSLILMERLGQAQEATGARKDAVETFHRALAAIGGDVTVEAALQVRLRHSLAISLVALGAHEPAARAAEEAIGIGAGVVPERAPSLYAIAGKARLRLGDWDRARKWGAESLRLKDAEAARIEAEVSPCARERPAPFDPDRKQRNIIAYSLFGTGRYYMDCAIVNARIAMASFPDFTPRFYCGEEVPKAALDELVRQKAEVKIVKNRVSPWEGLFWRFWAFDDPDVDVVLIRDVDSPLTPRERVAVEDWLYNSGAPFHVMRDHPLHTAPMMAGLWGGFTGLLPPFKDLTRRYLKEVSFRYSDQSFLKHFVWPRIRSAALAHDSQYALGDSRDFPPWGRVCRPIHVGWAWPAGEVKKGRTAY